MVYIDIIGLIVACIVLVKAADFAIKSIHKISSYYRVSEYVASFLIAGVVSTFPEASVLLTSAIFGTQGVGLGTVLGNNLIDLTLVLGLIAFFGSKLSVKSKSIEQDIFYLILCLLPFLLALDSNLTRIDGIILLLAGGLYIGHLVKESRLFTKAMNNGIRPKVFTQFAIFAASVSVIFIASNYVVKFANNLAIDMGVSPFFIGLTIVALGAALPELTFSIRSRAKGKNEISLGNLFGNIVIDATIIIGLAAVISPFGVDVGSLMFVGIFTTASLITGLFFMRSGWVLTKKEGLVLILIYIMFLVSQIFFAR